MGLVSFVPNQERITTAPSFLCKSLSLELTLKVLLRSKPFAVLKKTLQQLVIAMCYYKMKRTAFLLSLNIYLAIINDKRMM